MLLSSKHTRSTMLFRLKHNKSDYQSKTATKEQIAAYEAKLEAALKTKMANYGQAKFNEDYDVTDQNIAVFTGKLSENYLQEAYDAADLEAKIPGST